MVDSLLLLPPRLIVALPTQNRNVLMLIERLTKVLTDIEKRVSKPTEYAPSVECLSYHIEKTAGTSFRAGLERAYGKHRVFGVYKETGAKDLSHGRAIFIPRGTKVLHGHFKTNQHHLKQFPNAKRIVWLRDPCERAVSHINHILTYKQPRKLFDHIDSHYLNKGISTATDIFNHGILDSSLRAVFSIYSMYFKEISIADFDFVGRTENINADIAKCERLLNCSLALDKLNTAQQQNYKKNKQIRSDAKDILSKEYELYNTNL